MEISAQRLKPISCEDTQYPHIPQELVCGPVVAELGLLVNPHDHVDPSKCSHFLRSGGIPLLVWLTSLPLLRIQVGLAGNTVKERWLPEEAEEIQVCGVRSELVDWTGSLSEWSDMDGVKVA